MVINANGNTYGNIQDRILSKCLQYFLPKCKLHGDQKYERNENAISMTAGKREVKILGFSV